MHTAKFIGGRKMDSVKEGIKMEPIEPATGDTVTKPGAEEQIARPPR